jgi:hypothetical protein
VELRCKVRCANLFFLNFSQQILPLLSQLFFCPHGEPRDLKPMAMQPATAAMGVRQNCRLREICPLSAPETLLPPRRLAAAS